MPHRASSPDWRQQSELVLETINGSFPDSLLLVGRVLGGRPDATTARAVAIDAEGLDLALVHGGGEHAVRIEFATPVVPHNDADETWARYRRAACVCATSWRRTSATSLTIPSNGTRTSTSTGPDVVAK